MNECFENYQNNYREPIPFSKRPRVDGEWGNSISGQPVRGGAGRCVPTSSPRAAPPSSPSRPSSSPSRGGFVKTVDEPGRVAVRPAIHWWDPPQHLASHFPATSGNPSRVRAFCKQQSLAHPCRYTGQLPRPQAGIAFPREMSPIPGCKPLTAARANALKREGGSAHVLGRTRGDPPADTASRRLHATKGEQAAACLLLRRGRRLLRLGGLLLRHRAAGLRRRWMGRGE